MICRGWRWYVAGCLLLAAGGCGSAPARETAPAINPTDAGNEAVNEYDADHDGAIAKAELDKCPALKWALKRYDTHGDGRVTADNIAARIANWQQGSSAMSLFAVRMTLDGQPLIDATVTAEPEKFLGAAVLPATGTTDSNGRVMLQIADKPGANYGLYKIRVSKMVAGKETIPARYNAETVLGLEFAPDVPEFVRAGYNLELNGK